MAKYITISGFCSTTKKPLGIQLRNDGTYYSAVGSFSVSAGCAPTSNGSETNGKIVPDGFSCKYCQNTCVIPCACCGVVLCVQNATPKVTCPACGGVTNITWVDNIDEVSDASINGSKQ